MKVIPSSSPLLHVTLTTSTGRLDGAFKTISRPFIFSPLSLLWILGEPPLSPLGGCSRLLPPHLCHLITQQPTGPLHTTQHPTLAFCRTKSRRQSPFKVLHDLDAPGPTVASWIISPAHSLTFSHTGSLWFLERARQLSASRPWYMMFCLSGMLLPHISAWLTSLLKRVFYSTH